MDELWVERLGVLGYAEALELQRRVARARISGAIAEDVLLLVEHPPVVTLGRSAKEKNLLVSPQLLAARGVELFEVERGGDVTFHGPGQLVGYPIIDLKRHKRDLHWYLRQVEEALIVAPGERGADPKRLIDRLLTEKDVSIRRALIVALGEMGIDAGRNPGLTGVWTGNATRKIASIGVHARDWVTWHGFALNVSTDLSYFDLMVPCGIEAVTMTSIARELGPAAPGIEVVRRCVSQAFGRVFDLVQRDVEPGFVSGLIAAT